MSNLQEAITLDADIARLRKKYPRWMSIGELALELDISTADAARKVRRGHFGEVYAPNKRFIRIYTGSVIDHMRNPTKIQRTFA